MIASELVRSHSILSSADRFARVDSSNTTNGDNAQGVHMPTPSTSISAKT